MFNEFEYFHKRWWETFPVDDMLCAVLSRFSCVLLCDPMDYSPARLLCPWDSLGKNTGVGTQSLLQGIVPTQGSNPGLLDHRQILFCLSHQGNPKPA